MIETFLLCFIPLFVAVDPPGILPMFAALTDGMDPARRNRLIVSSAVTALVVGAGFVLAGETVLRFMGIAMSDFMIAGGLVLLIVSLSDLLTTDKIQRRVDPDALGPVPIGVPLMVGPAVLTTGLLLDHRYGPGMTLAALTACILLTALAFRAVGFFQRVVGKTAEKVLSKLASLLLAALAVMLIRRGIQTGFLSGG